MDPGAPPTLRAAFGGQVVRRGDRPALVDDAGSLSYAALDAAASEIARRLADDGIGAGMHVALVLPPDPRRVIGAVASIKAGCAYVPIDASLDATRIAELVAHARCAAMLVEAGDGIGIVPCDTATRAQAAVTGAAYLRFTSGSTGAPKAILHGQLAALRLAEAFAASVEVEAEDRVSLFNPFWHTLVWGALITGAALHVFDLRRGPAALADWIDREAITVYSSFPTAFRAFAAALAPGRRLCSVRRVSLSGETLARSDVDAARTHFAPDCVLVNSYGASELGHIAAYRIAPDAPLDTDSIPVGVPLPGVALRLLDAQLRPARGGEDGQIAVRCAHLAAGYWQRPDVTARSYVADPETAGGVLYLTGDIGRFDARERLHVVGRCDRQLKVRGHRVQPDEIEAVLAAHPDVAEAAVSGFAHWSGDTRLAAFVVARDGRTPDPRDLRAHVAAKLPAYMVPLHVTRMPALPRAASGKVDWRALPEPPVSSAPGAEPPWATALQLQILHIWEEQLTARPIALDDDFFALGGNSLAATEVALHLEALTGMAMPATAVFETPTIRALAARIAAAEPPPAPVTTVNAGGARAPLFFFHPDARAAFYGGALAQRLSPDQPVHVIAPQGSRPGDALPASFEAMGAARAALVERLQTDGPLALAGFCNGALIAYETAHALRRAGREVDLLVMIDPPSSHVLPPALRTALDIADRVAAPLLRREAPTARALGHAIHLAHRLRELSRESRLLAALLGRLRRRPPAAPTSATGTAGTGFDLYGALNDIGRVHLPRRFAGPLEVLMSDALGHNRYLPHRWRRVVPDVALGTLPGGHLGCITRESAALAAILDERLRARWKAR